MTKRSIIRHNKMLRLGDISMLAGNDFMGSDEEMLLHLVQALRLHLKNTHHLILHVSTCLLQQQRKVVLQGTRSFWT